jgi:integrase
MGNVAKRQDGRWRARYRDEAGKEHARHFDRKLDATRWLATVEADLLRGTYVDPKAGLVKLRDYSEQWRTAQMHRPSTAVYFETMMRRHIYPTFGDRPLGTVRPTEVQAWVRCMSGTLAPATVKVVHGILASIYKAAIRDRKVVESPYLGTALPKVEPKRIEPLSTDQVERLIEAVPDRYRALIVLAAGTGMHNGEALGLTVDRIDFLRRIVRVDRQLVLVQHHEPFLGPPKTSASHRTIPLPQVVVDTLAAHLSAYPALPSRVRVGSIDAPHQEVELVFRDASDGPIRRTSFSTVWRPAAKAAGLPDGETFHALRHYYASLLIRHGESIKTVQARLGHATAAETLDTYSHLWPDSEDRTRDAVDSVLGRADRMRTAVTP